jgi:hypothetical protein
VTGSEIPLTENCDPLTPTDDTVTGALLAVKVAAWLCVLPIVTLPKLMDAGAMASCPAATPVPASAKLVDVAADW